MKAEEFVERADELIAQADEAMKNTYDMNGLVMVNAEPYNEFRSGTLSFLKNVFGEEHPYYREFDKVMSGSSPRMVERGKGVLTAARKEIASGWIKSARTLLAADIFGDFLEMGDYLLAEKYKDPAAVIVGSVLEEHLRQLASSRGIEIAYLKDGRTVPKKAETLNMELAKAGAYGTLDQKNVTAWLDLRNKAAHGKYSEYGHAQVELLLQSVRDFVARVAA